MYHQSDSFHRAVGLRFMMAVEKYSVADAIGKRSNKLTVCIDRNIEHAAPQR
jgi:hypothetical protein